jgi:hypothetical protein
MPAYTTVQNALKGLAANETLLTLWFYGSWLTFRKNFINEGAANFRIIYIDSIRSSCMY